MTVDSNDTVYATMHLPQDPATTWEEIGWLRTSAVGPVLFTRCYTFPPTTYPCFVLVPGMQLRLHITTVIGDPNQWQSLVWWGNQWWILNQRPMGAVTQTDVVFEMHAQDDSHPVLPPYVYVLDADYYTCAPTCQFYSWDASFTSGWWVHAPYQRGINSPDSYWHAWGGP